MDHCGEPGTFIQKGNNLTIGKPVVRERFQWFLGTEHAVLFDLSFSGFR